MIFGAGLRRDQLRMALSWIMPTWPRKALGAEQIVRTGDTTSSGLLSEASTFVRKLRRRPRAETFGTAARKRNYRRMWIDVGAHAGASTRPYAAAQPSLRVSAF